MSMDGLGHDEKRDNFSCGLMAAANPIALTLKGENMEPLRENAARRLPASGGWSAVTASNSASPSRCTSSSDPSKVPRRAMR